MLKSIDAKTELELKSESALLDLARSGDEQAIRLLIKRNNQRLFRVARSVLRNDAEAEDVVQETYVKAFTNLRSFQEKAQFSTWLTRIALNESISRVRKRRDSSEVTALDVELSSDPGLATLFPISLMPLPADTQLARMEMRDLLEHAVDALPEAFRLVFILRDVEGLSIEETALQLDVKPETVKTRLHRARHLLRADIEDRLSASFADIFPFDGARCSNLADRVIERLRQR